jgi:hypothetical protein
MMEVFLVRVLGTARVYGFPNNEHLNKYGILRELGTFRGDERKGLPTFRRSRKRRREFQGRESTGVIARITEITEKS